MVPGPGPETPHVDRHGRPEGTRGRGEGSLCGSDSLTLTFPTLEAVTCSFHTFTSESDVVLSNRARVTCHLHYERDPLMLTVS